MTMQAAQPVQQSSAGPLQIGSLTDWQAAIGAFTLLFIVADTAAAPVADAIAWGAAILYVANILIQGTSASGKPTFSLPLGNLNPNGGSTNGGA